MSDLNEGLALDLAVLAFDGPPLEPGHLVGRLQHVVAVPARDRHERDRRRVVTCTRFVLLLCRLRTGFESLINLFTFSFFGFNKLQ